MKKLLTVFFAAALLVMGLACSWVYAQEDDPITSSVESKLLNADIEVHTSFNQFGIALTSTSTSTQVVQTTDENGKVTTTTTTTVTTSSYKNGNLSPDVSKTDSVTKNDEGKVTSESHYTDTYTYDSSGYLTGCGGSGWTESVDYAKNPDTGEIEEVGTRHGTITRTFDVADGQARLQSMSTVGDIFDKEGKEIGTFDSTTTFSDWQYLGGQWVANTETSTSISDVPDQYHEEVTRVKKTERNEQGLITGISQTASGTRTVYTGADGETKSSMSYTMTNYNAVAKFDSQQGWYISDESYKWTLDTIADPDADPTAYDPWTKGTLAIVGGRLALVVDPDDVKGKEFYNMDPSELTGETQTDENGNMIFLLLVDDAQTKEELMDLVGKEINMMWQYYIRSDANDTTSGYSWLKLAPTSDGRVACHLKSDSEAKVEQWGGEWDRSKQYVVIN